MKYFSLLLLGSAVVLSGCGQDVEDMPPAPEDVEGPVLTEITPIGTTDDLSPHYTFKTTEPGTLSYEGECSSTTTFAEVGVNTIRLDLIPFPSIPSTPLPTYSNCQIKITDQSGNESGVLTVSSFTIREFDAGAPVIAVESPVAAVTSRVMPPVLQFSSDEAGELLLAGGCSSASTTVVEGSNTITFNTPKTSSYPRCSVRVRDAAGNISNTLRVPFAVDLAAPVLRQVTPIADYARSSVLAYTFSSTEAGVISYGGACSGDRTVAAIGDNAVNFSVAAEGNYKNCTITVTDALGNVSPALRVRAFTVDDSAPVLAEVVPVPGLANKPGPRYTFSSNEPGSVVYNGSCVSATTLVRSGKQTIKFNDLPDGSYQACSLVVTDRAGNIASLPVSTFEVDTAAPVLLQEQEVTPATANPGQPPVYRFSTTEAGELVLGGGCTSADTAVLAGSNNITFATVKTASYPGCTVSVRDNAGNLSVAIAAPFNVDMTAPVLKAITPVAEYAQSGALAYTFRSNEAGYISYLGSCGDGDIAVTLPPAAAMVVAGDNTVNYSIAADGRYADCSIVVSDALGNVSSALAIRPFTVDNTAPLLAETRAVTSPGNDATPRYGFSSTEVGVISYGGACTGTEFSALAGINRIDFAPLMDNTYTDCTLSVSDRAGNQSAALPVTAFTIDTVLPILEEKTAVASLGNVATPDYAFSSTETGRISYAGGCQSQTSHVLAVAPALTTITLNTLKSGSYDNCKITVRDEAGNSSVPLLLTPFVVDTIVPALKQVSKVPSPGKSLNPAYGFYATEAGELIYGGSCDAAAVTAVKGYNNVILGQAPGVTPFAEGSYDDCTITLRDAVGNTSTPLSVSAFSVDLTGPLLTELIPVPASGIDTRPYYTFSSNEVGTITYPLACVANAKTVRAGNNKLRFNAMPVGFYDDSNCSITVTDGAGNATVLDVSEFTIVKARPLNDTGIVACGDFAYGGSLNHDNALACGSSRQARPDYDFIPRGQDAQMGRDRRVATNTDADGFKGFSFTKMDEDTGVALAASATAWGCVRDNVTGLVWEVKKDGFGIRGKNTRYARADVSLYIDVINGEMPTELSLPLCGMTGWRLPTAEELQSIVNYGYGSGEPAIDVGYFPHAVAGTYWTSTVDQADSSQSWVIDFASGLDGVVAHTDSSSVRLVRDPQ